MGGYVWARYWHFLAMVVLVALSLGHIFMVFTVDPQALKSMTIGGYDETRSPEARNARPFYHLFARQRPKEEEARPALAPTEAFQVPSTPPTTRTNGDRNESQS